MIKRILNNVCTLLLWGGILLGGTGCGDSHPTTSVLSASSLNAGQTNTGTAGQLTEDTHGSAIDISSHPEDTIVIVAIGDSITQGQGGDRRGGYPLRLERKLTEAGYNVVVKNRGIRGERSYSTYQRWLSEIANADISLLMIGTNDIVNPANCHDRFDCRTRDYIENMINQSLISKKIPLVSTLPLATSDGNRAWANPKILELNAQIRNMARIHEIGLVDTYQIVADHGGDSLYFDSLHLTDAGYEIIAQQWFDTLVHGGFLEAAQQ